MSDSSDQGDHIDKQADSQRDELNIDLNRNGVLTLTMNRPHVNNAFDEHQIVRLTEELARASKNSEVKIVVLAGAGKHFCAGADINYMQRMGNNTTEENRADARRLAKLLKTLNYLPQPTIAQVHGAVFGGGVGLVSCCDIAIGSTSSVFSLSEVKIGLVPATISPYVIAAVGSRAARRLFVTGERVKAEAAMRLGFLHQLSGPDELNETINQVLDVLLENSPSAMQAAKATVFSVADGRIDDAVIEKTVQIIADVRASADGREGTLAFLEKRKPDWS